MAKPHSTLKECVWDVAIACHMEFKCNPVMTFVIIIANVRAVSWLQLSISSVFQLMTQDTSRAVHFSCFTLLSTHTQILNPPVNRIFQISCD